MKRALLVLIAAVGLCAAMKETSVSVWRLPAEQTIGGFRFQTPKGLGWRGMHTVSDKTGGEIREYHKDKGYDGQAVEVLHRKPNATVTDAASLIAWLNDPATSTTTIQRGGAPCVLQAHVKASPITFRTPSGDKVPPRKTWYRAIHCLSREKAGWVVSLELSESGVKIPAADFAATAEKMIAAFRPA